MRLIASIFVLFFLLFAYSAFESAATKAQFVVTEIAAPAVPLQPAPAKQPEPELIVKAIQPAPKKCNASCTCPDCPNCVVQVVPQSAATTQVVRQCGPTGCTEVRVPVSATPVQGSYGQSMCGPGGCGRSGFFRGRRGR